MSGRFAPLLSSLFVVILGLGLAGAAPPALDDPLIKGISPEEGRTGQHVQISGVHFGASPEVRFGGILAPIVASPRALRAATSPSPTPAPARRATAPTSPSSPAATPPSVRSPEP
jgi:hypothetical protein